MNWQLKLVLATSLWIVALSGGMVGGQQPDGRESVERTNVEQEREQLKRELAQLREELAKAKAALKAERAQVEQERALAHRARAEKARGEQAVAAAEEEEEESALGKLQQAAKFVAQQRLRLTGDDEEEEVKRGGAKQKGKPHAKQAKLKAKHQGGERIVSVRLNLDILVVKRSEASQAPPGHKDGAKGKKKSKPAEQEQTSADNAAEEGK